MKKKLFFGLLALALVSCSGNEDNQIVNVSKDEAEIVEAEETEEVELDSIVINEWEVMKFENNKMQTRFTPGHGTYYFNYGIYGQLSGLIGKDIQGEVFFTQSLVYDNTGRIIEKTEINYNSIMDTSTTQTVAYIYNEDNTVTLDYNSFDETAYDRTFHFNQAGLVDKIVFSQGSTLIYEYSGNALIASGLQGYMSTYQYDEATPVKGEYLNIYSNMFSNYTNFVLYNGSIGANTVSHNYMIKMDNPGGDDYDFIYEFNEMGYPVKETMIRALNPGNIIRITYK